MALYEMKGGQLSNIMMQGGAHLLPPFLVAMLTDMAACFVP